MAATNESTTSDIVSNLPESSRNDLQTTAHIHRPDSDQHHQNQMTLATAGLINQQQNYTPTTASSASLPPPVVYGELSILGYNGYIPNVEKNGRKNRSKFLLCKRPAPNGIRKSRHYIVKQPQDTKAILDKERHSISYTFSRSQAIIVEYTQDENTDMFQIGRSSEDPIDFVVMDTFAASVDSNVPNSISGHSSGSRHRSGNHNENNSSSHHHQQMSGNDLMMGLNRHFHRQLAKVGDEILHYSARTGAIPSSVVNDSRNRQIHFQRHHHHHPQAVLLNYPQPNISNLPPMMADHFRNHHDPISLFHHSHHLNHHQLPHSSGISPQQQQSMQSSVSRYGNGADNNIDNQQFNNEHCSSRHNLACKQQRSHATQSTISRFACRILVDRKPPYTARIYAAGFDSSKNIFLGEKATKWEQNDTIDGLTTNGVLLMHPKRGKFYKDIDEKPDTDQFGRNERSKAQDARIKTSGDMICEGYQSSSKQQTCSNTGEPTENILKVDNSSAVQNDISISIINSEEQTRRLESSLQTSINKSVAEVNQIENDSNNNNNNINSTTDNKFPRNKTDFTANESSGGIWREVSVDGGIYAIRESRSAAQKGTIIKDETNVLKDGTLIDLCGATLLWRSVDGFKASPTKKSLEEKIDMLNASRPQCPVGLNTLVIPRKPVLPTNQQHRSGHHSHHSHSHHNKEHSDKNNHQPYVYLKCGHVQGYHDWGAIEKSNQRTCPICLSVGSVAKLSMGLEPSFYVNSGPLTHVFNPCGHMASEDTVKYWCSIKIPHGTHFFHSICPFCATPLATSEPASTKLIFQDDLD